MHESWRLRWSHATPTLETPTVEQATNFVNFGNLLSFPDKSPEKGSRGMWFCKGCDPLTSRCRLCRTSECPSQCYASRTACTCWSRRGNNFTPPTGTIVIVQYQLWGIIGNNILSVRSWRGGLKAFNDLRLVVSCGGVWNIKKMDLHVNYVLWKCEFSRCSSSAASYAQEVP